MSSSGTIRHARSAKDRALYCWGEKTSGLGLDDDGATTFSPRRIATFRAPIQSLVIGTWETKDTIVALLDGDVLANAGDSPVGETSLVGEVPAAPLELEGVRLAGAFAYVTTDGLLEQWRNRFGSILIDSLYIPSSKLSRDLQDLGRESDAAAAGRCGLVDGSVLPLGPEHGGHPRHAARDRR